MISVTGMLSGFKKIVSNKNNLSDSETINETEGKTHSMVSSIIKSAKKRRVGEPAGEVLSMVKK